MANEKNPKSTISYYQMRFIIGVFGFFLPIVVVFSANYSILYGESRPFCVEPTPALMAEYHFDDPAEMLATLCPQKWTLRSSLSAHYHSPSRDWLVGMLVAVALFMYAYKGPNGEDAVYGKILAITALGTALFPTEAKVGQSSIPSIIHLASAAILLLTAATLFIFRFTKTAPGKDPSPEKLKWNRVYRAMGIGMYVAVGLTALSFAAEPLLGIDAVAMGAVTILEAIALFFFGAGWIFKGRKLFDRNRA